MLNYNHYLPILKGKEGEFLALKELDKNVKSSITPLIEIPKAGTMQRNKEEIPKPLDFHLKNVSDKINDCWEKELPFFVDFNLKPTLLINNSRLNMDSRVLSNHQFNQ